MLTIYLPSTKQNETESFYVNNFGFYRLTAHGPVVWLKNSSGITLGIEEVEQAESFPPTFRLEFKTESRQEAEEILDSFRKQGADITYPLFPSSEVHIAYTVRDPDQRPVMVVWMQDTNNRF